MTKVTIRTKGSFENSLKFLNFLKNREYINCLDEYGKKGVEALAEATPKRTGKTSKSWRYEVTREPGAIRLTWLNDNVVDDWANVAVLIQYGHGTGNGGYVEGIDYINPALKPIFEEIANKVWKEVEKSCRT